jgi:hypothetical protein
LDLECPPKAHVLKGLIPSLSLFRGGRTLEVGFWGRKWGHCNCAFKGTVCFPPTIRWATSSTTHSHYSVLPHYRPQSKRPTNMDRNLQNCDPK